MTRVTFYRRPDGLCVGYRAQGHANFGEYGSDIVCAAVSALTQATYLGISEVISAKAQMKSESGLFSVMLDEDQSAQLLEKAQLLLDTLEKALYSISGDPAYGGSVRVDIRERR